MSLHSSAQTVDRQVGADAERYGRYEILEKLATGGMGEVYLARSVGAAGFRKHVVIKRILPHLVEHGHFVDALVREAKILVMLDHPNIVQVLDLGVEGGDYFMAMEFVHGYNFAAIAHYCAQKRLVIPVPACAAVAFGVLAGLEYAHGLVGPDGERQNIIHRDVSPQNVMISRDGRVKLTDFGIAKVLNAAEGEFTTSLKGKFRYMAPEAVDGGRMDQRYDLFAVGILLFEALCRRHLFGGRSDVDILKQVRAARVPELARYHPGISPAVEQVTRVALAREPKDRFQTAGDFAMALRSAIHPLSESEACAQLRAFVGDLYERPDFPINKPKLPDLKNARFEATRSIVLRSHLGQLGEEAAPPVPASATVTAPTAGSMGRLAIGLITIVLALLVGIVGYLVYLMQSYQRPRRAEVVRVLPRQAVQAVPMMDGTHGSGRDGAVQGSDGSARHLDSRRGDNAGGRSDLAGRGSGLPAAGARPVGRSEPRIVSFTPQIGRRVFGRHSFAIKQCLDRHAQAGQQVRISVVSEIRGDGRVDTVTLEPSDQIQTPLGRCLIAIASRIKYPRHDRALITYKQPVMVRVTP